jgi:hypothetical protein
MNNNTPETNNTETPNHGVERYVEMSITIGFTAKQTSALMANDPNFGAGKSFQSALVGLQDLVEDTWGAKRFDPTILSDIGGVFQMDPELFEAAGVEPMRAAVRFRESEEWTAESKPNLYTDDGNEFLKNPPAYGYGEHSLPQ